MMRRVIEFKLLIFLRLRCRTLYTRLMGVTGVMGHFFDFFSTTTMKNTKLQPIQNFRALLSLTINTNTTISIFLLIFSKHVIV